MAHVELKAKYDTERGRYINPTMIEVAACLAGGRKAIMAQATVPGWYPFDALMDAHCGFPLRMPPSFSPVKVCRQVFIPSDKNGILVGYTGANFDRLKSYNDHIMLCEKGKRVKRAQDLTSFAGYVRLIGTQDQVEMDSESARSGFVVEVNPEGDPKELS